MIVKIKYVVFVFLCCHSLVFSMGPVAEYIRNKMRTKDNFQSLLSVFIDYWSEDDYEYAQELEDQGKRFQLFIEKGIDFDQISTNKYYHLLCENKLRRRHDIYQAIVKIRNNSDEYGTSSFSRQTASPMSNTFHPSTGLSAHEDSNTQVELKAQLIKMKSELEAQLNQMEFRYLQLENTSAALRSTIDQLRDENQNLQADNHELARDRSRSRKRHEESLANERRARSASRGRKNKELDEVRQREASLREQLQQAQDELEKKTSKGLLGFVGKKEKPKERGRSPTRRHILK